MWSRRRRDDAGPYLFDDHFPHDAVPAGKPAELVGIARHSPDALYEFETTDGTHVTLHDLDCVAIDVRPMEHTLTLAFAHEPDTSPALRLHFEGARILRWRLDTPLGPREHAGEVRDLWWDNNQTFALYMTYDEIAFTATHLTVTTQPAPGLGRP